MMEKNAQLIGGNKDSRRFWLRAVCEGGVSCNFVVGFIFEVLKMKDWYSISVAEFLKILAVRGGCG
jgi:hypothetical protein